MKKLHGMKLSQAFALIITVVVVIFIIGVFANSKMVSADKKESDIEKKVETEKAEQISTVMYTEGDEELDYNYIINPEVLNGYPISYEGAAVLGREVNEFLKTSGYTSRELTIIRIEDSDSLQLSFNIKISDSNDILYVKYDVDANKYEFFLELQ